MVGRNKEEMRRRGEKEEERKQVWIILLEPASLPITLEQCELAMRDLTSADRERTDYSSPEPGWAFFSF